jgi:hypothetical protein
MPALKISSSSRSRPASAEWEQVPHLGASRQHVRAPPPQLASTRPGQDEAESLAGHQVLHFVEHRRHTLHLVDDDPSPIGQSRALAGQDPWLPAEAETLRCQQEVVVRSVGEVPADPGRFPGATGAEEEERVARWVQQAWKHRRRTY